MVPVCIRGGLVFCIACVLLLFALASRGAQTPDAAILSQPTSARVKDPGWWPTKGTAPLGEYSGSAACAKCHAAKFDSYLHMAMSQASLPTPDSALLQQHPDLTFTLGPYKYQLATSGGKSSYSVSDGKSTLTEELPWAFGVGVQGQTYVYEDHGNFYESHLSFYKAIEGLDITTGHLREMPDSLQQAAGRRMYSSETQHCFGCHMTASMVDGKFAPVSAFEGIACEACHGPGANHVAAENSKMEGADALIFNPKHLSTFDSTEFCGACHRTTGDVIESGWDKIGVMNVRFQPYRLQNSRCWSKSDARIACVTCHDPHQPLVHEAAAYDSRCLSCHVASPKVQPTAEHPGKACPVRTTQCVTCHMPKYEVPGSHSMFADHWIRVVRAGEAYPE